jgi:hypothetical protein
MAWRDNVWGDCLLAVQALTASPNIWTGWDAILPAVHPLRDWANSWTGWAAARDVIHCLADWASRPRDCWWDLKNVPADWARDERDRLWEGARVVVHCLAALDKSWRGWERARSAVHCLATCVASARDCWMDFRKLSEDWAMVRKVRDCMGSLDIVNCLEALVKTRTA